MQLRKLHIENYRSIEDGEITFESCTRLIGGNNAGKSTVLRALELFFSGQAKVTPEDFFMRDVDRVIRITAEFDKLVPAEMEKFSGNMIDGHLIVTREFFGNLSSKDNGNYSVTALVNRAFSDCRGEEGKAKKRELYKELQKTYVDLPNVSNAEEIENLLDRWEQSNPSHLTRERVGSFRGWKNVAAGQLRDKTELILVPAVQDAARETVDPKSSAIIQLLSAIARQTIENNPEFQEFMSEVTERASKLTDPQSVKELSEMNVELNSILNRYYAESSIAASWEKVSSIPIAYPVPSIAAKDGDLYTSVEKVGHGLQRAIILTMLEYISQSRKRDSSPSQFTEAQSDIIIALEEPELYQHPIKQRHFSDVIDKLCGVVNPNSGIRV